MLCVVVLLIMLIVLIMIMILLLFINIIPTITTTIITITIIPIHPHHAITNRLQMHIQPIYLLHIMFVLHFQLCNGGLVLFHYCLIVFNSRLVLFDCRLVLYLVSLEGLNYTLLCCQLWTYLLIWLSLPLYVILQVLDCRLADYFLWL